MSKYRCEHCDELQDIRPNGADPMKTSKRQRLGTHIDKKTGKFCLGSETDV